MIMTKRFTLFSILFLLYGGTCVFGQSAPYILMEFPLYPTLLKQDTAIWIKWTGASRDPANPDLVPDSGRIYFSKSPGGSIIDNYTDSITKRVINTVISGDDTSYISQDNILSKSENPPLRGIQFRPNENGMGAGTYYMMVGWKTSMNGVDTTFYSDEIIVLVDADAAVQPELPAKAAEIEDLTPTFKWKSNPGVPYYHVIVSDKKITFNTDSNTVDNLSPIWQAITSNTQVTYGTPDPSGTITSDPPPMSPGVEYSWVVLNNFGNNPLATSDRFGIPWTFKIKGLPLKAPVNVSPSDNDTITSDVATITFKWANLDTNANTYKLYLYVASTVQGVNAQMIVWSNEVTAGQFSGDTASITLDAKSVLTDNYYTWKVMAIDKKGAGTSGNLTGFKYKAPTGVIKVQSREMVLGKERVVKYAEVKVEVLDGSMEAPLLFYTENDGNMARSRPVGTYRLTMVKDGFTSQTKTVTVTSGDTVTSKFILQRPDGTMFGKVLDGAGKALNLAIITAVSDRGDTATAETDPSGNFIVRCSEADWKVSASKNGYIPSLPRDTSVKYGQSVDLKTPIVLVQNPYLVSGTVVNTANEPVIGAKVQLLRDNVVVSQIPSTPQTGFFTFSVEAGTYTLKASKTGFTSYNEQVIITNSVQLTVRLDAGAAMIRGYVYGRSWKNNVTQVYAPVTDATIMLIDTTVTPYDTITAVSDDVYGDFAVSTSGGKVYKMYSSAAGYISSTKYTDLIASGKTYTLHDTMAALASVKGGLSISGTVTDSSNITINLIDTTTKTIIASAKSDALGTFEIRNIPDGLYQIQAGKVGLVAKSIVVFDTAGVAATTDLLRFTDHRPVKADQQNQIIDSVYITMESGTKALQWFINHKGSALTRAAVKVQSPLQKVLTATQSIGGIGVGSYIISIDADSADIMDCSYHTYTLAVGADSLHTDTVIMPVVHRSADTLSLSGGMVACTVTVSDTSLSSGYLYFKDINAAAFDSVAYTGYVTRSTDKLYTFQFSPLKDATHLVYYFQLKIGTDIYGYEQETYRSYIMPDPKVLSRLTIVPWSKDTLLLPADASVKFTFKAFYGSLFLPADQLTPAHVSWSIVNPNGCSIQSQTTGNDTPSVVLKTAVNGTGDNVAQLQARFISSEPYTLAAGISDTVTLALKVTAGKLDSISVLRVDSDARKNYITTSSLDRAQFLAQGIDVLGNKVTISANWEHYPQTAGTISDGTFDPSDDFVGYVQIYAKVGKIVGQYNRLYGDVVNQSGLDVHYIIPYSKDTVNSGQGCRIIIPANLIDSSDIGEIAMEKTVLEKNKLLSISGDYDIVGDAYEIEKIRGGEFNIQNDSITISIDVPSEYQDAARSKRALFYVARWNSDSIKWNPDTSSIISVDGKEVSVKTAHFSRYALLHKAVATDASFAIKPNPFSPYVKPFAEFLYNAQMGTCFEIRPASRYKNSLTLQVDIYNVVGVRVWSAILQNAQSSALYRVWWNGKTTSRTEPLTQEVKLEDTEAQAYMIAGEKMCRNGRYFVVLTIDDTKKKKFYTKPIVLFK